MSKEAQLAGVSWKMRRLPVNQLDVDPEVQRPPPTSKQVQELVDKFALAAVGALHVSKRPSGFLHVVDGQRRLAAMLVLGLHNQRVDCQVYEGLTKAQEAALWNLLNTHRAGAAWDKYNMSVLSRDPVCTGIQKTCTKHGWETNRSSRDGCIACVNAMRRVWALDSDGTALNDALYAITMAWGHEGIVASGCIVEGVGKFLAAGGPEIDLDKLSEKLKTRDPVALVTKARQYRELHGGSISHGLMLVVNVLYKRRTRRS